MVRITNLVACAVVAILCALIGNGTIDQDVLRRGAQEWAYAPATWFALAALLNLRKE